MANKTIKMPNGTEITLSSEALSQADLVVAEVLLELAAEQGNPAVETTLDEIARRIAAKGYDPATGDPIH